MSEYCKILRCANYAMDRLCEDHIYFNKEVLQSLLSDGIKLNYEWCAQNPQHPLSIEFSPSPFYDDQGEGIETCCFITANAVSEKLGIKKWLKTNLDFENARKMEIPLRIELGYFEDDPNHVLLLIGDTIVDSFYQERSLSFFPLPYFETTDLGPLLNLTNLGSNECLGWKMHIFIPC